MPQSLLCAVYSHHVITARLIWIFIPFLYSCVLCFLCKEANVKLSKTLKKAKCKISLCFSHYRVYLFNTIISNWYRGDLVCSTYGGPESCCFIISQINSFYMPQRLPRVKRKERTFAVRLGFCLGLVFLPLSHHVIQKT